jgi:hypothetical protein
MDLFKKFLDRFYIFNRDFNQQSSGCRLDFQNGLTENKKRNFSLVLDYKLSHVSFATDHISRIVTVEIFITIMKDFFLICRFG